MNHNFLLVLFFISAFAYGQNLSGTVKDSLNTPLSNANVIATPKQANGKVKFSIADHLGRYKLELEKETDYEIRVSYIGYEEQVFHFEHLNALKFKDFNLKSKNLQLTEVVITHKFEPIVIKKDTVSFKVDAFTSGNERKLGEQLQKLPGVEVDKDGIVTFQGKKVSTLLVEDKPFFGGGTKLGVQNIPSGVVDKAEFIDDFNEVGFMKEVSGSDQLALNIKLKEDKKQFVFGDLQAGYGLENFYLGHAALFYYSAKLSLAYIADANNFGQRVFTFEDLIRFQGGYSSFLTNRKRYDNLWSLSNDKTDMAQNQSFFNALNINTSPLKKLDINGYLIFSKVFQNFEQFQNLSYLQTQVQENRTTKSENKNRLLSTNIKVDYSPQKKTKWYYNFYSELANNSFNENIASTSNSQNSTFDNYLDSDIQSFRQYIERHQRHNKKHTTTFVINHSFDSNRPFQTWLTNQPFLSGLIPLQSDEQYEIQKIQKTVQNSIEFMFKHYFTFNPRNHLYAIFGNRFTNNSFDTNEKQILTNGQINDFTNAGFGNNMEYQLNDFYFGLEYKLQFKKWTNKPMIYAHLYDLKTIENTVNQNLKRFYLEPQWLSELAFSDTEKLTFNYVLKNEFPTEQFLADKFTLQNFNSVFKGNALLNNERFHQFSLNYFKNNLFKDLLIYANANYVNKAKNIRNSIVFDGINQFTTPILFDAPETNWMVNSSINKKIYRFNLGLITTLSGFSYLQQLDNITARNDRSSQLVGLSLRTQYKKWPSARITFNYGLNQLRGVQRSDFKSQNFVGSFDQEVFKNFVFKGNYDWNKNVFADRSDRFDRLDFSLEYKRENNPWIFELKVNNALNTQNRFVNSFSDFLISTQETVILPRVVVFMVSYKL